MPMSRPTNTGGNRRGSGRSAGRLKCRTICLIILKDQKSVQSMKGFTCVLTHVYLHCVFVCVRMVFFY